MDADDRHYPARRELLADGSVIVPFLGAGANLCDRPQERAVGAGPLPPERPRSRRAPSPSGAAIRSPTIPTCSASRSTSTRSSARDRSTATSATVFDADYPPTSLHRLLARLARLLRERGCRSCCVLTTNYDDLVERALADGGPSFDVVWYEAKPDAEARGRFLHRPPGGEVVRDRRGRTSTPASALARAAGGPEAARLRSTASDSKRRQLRHHREQLHRLPLGRRRRRADPDRAVAADGDSHFLFLGYSMRDWNLRVILNRIWGARKLDLKSWAVQREPADPNGARDRGGALARPRRTSTSSTAPLERVRRAARGASSVRGRDARR